MLRRLWYPLACLAAFGLLLTGAKAPKPSGPAPVVKTAAGAVPVVLPLTGSGAFLGRSEQGALQIFEKQPVPAGGHPVHFQFFDDQSNPQVAVQLTKQIVLGHPPVILGSALVGLCNAMAPLIEGGPVLYCLSPGIHPHAGSNVFTSSASTEDLMAATLTYFRTRGLTRVGLITSIDASGQDARRTLPALMARPENAGLKLVDNVFFNPSDISASAQIAQLKARKPQAVVVWSTGSAVGIILRGLTSAGLDVPVATTDGNMTYAQMKQYAAFMPKEFLIAAPAWVEGAAAASPQAAAAQAALHAAYAKAGQKPDMPAILAWDPALIVAAQMDGPQTAAADLKARIAGLQGFAATSGVYDMRKTPQRGLDASAVIVTRWDPKQHAWRPASGARGVAQASGEPKTESHTHV